MNEALLAVQDLERRFGGGRGLLGSERPSLHALQGVSLTLRQGETLGVVGESGCGKSTLARLIVGLDRPSAGSIHLAGRDVHAQRRREERPLAARIQYVFQDPVGALNPRKTIRAILEAPMIHLLHLSAEHRRERLAELLQAVGLREEFLERYPHEFSGGQAQRIGIARALAAEPEILVLDEPVSALDVSVQAQVLNLLAQLKQRFGLSYLFISHDLAVVESISDRVAVMYFGRVVELAPARMLFAEPRHPYTRLLLDSAPVPGRRKLDVAEEPAELPDPFDPPAGCAFAARCPRAQDRCSAELPLLEEKGEGQEAACFYPLGEEGGQ